MKADTIIFDLDGTLLNTLGDLHVAFNYALKEHGYREYGINEVKSFVGNGIKTAFEKALGDNTEKVDMDSIIESFKNYYIKHLYDLTKPYNGIIELLSTLKQMDYKLAVVSNKYDEAVKEICNHYFKGYIDIAIGESRDIRRKPSIDGLKKAVDYLGTNLNKIIYVGDSEVDIETAKNAGVPCISVLWGFKGKDFLGLKGGRIFAEVPNDILRILEKKIYLL